MITTEAIKYFTDLGAAACNKYIEDAKIVDDIPYPLVRMQSIREVVSGVNAFMVNHIKSDHCVKIEHKRFHGPDGKEYSGNNALEFFFQATDEMFGGPTAIYMTSTVEPGSVIIRLLSALNHNFNISIVPNE